MRTVLFALSILLAAALTACGADRDTAGGADPAADETGAAAGSEARQGDLETLYGEIDDLHGRMMGRYRDHADAMPADVQELYRHMDAMHDRAGELHRRMMDGGMHGGGMMEEPMGMHCDDHPRMGPVREWDRQMLSMHEAMARWHREQGHEEMASLHGRMVERYGQAVAEETEAPAGPAETAEPAPEREAEVAADGARLYAENCAGCHGSEGRGAGGIFPPLRGAQWVTGDPARLVRIILHGLEGPIRVAGSDYRGSMPSFASRLSDRQIAAILTHLRTSWGDDASAVEPDLVRSVRQETAGRNRPWTASALE